MPRRCRSGVTEIGPRPNQPTEPSEMETGEIATVAGDVASLLCD